MEENIIKGSFPKIRFKGFTDAWEQQRVGDYLNEFDERTTSNNEFPVLSSTSSGIYLQQEYFNHQTASQDTTGYKVVPENYFTYRSMSDTGSFTFNLQKCIKKGIVSPAYPVFTTNKIDKEFLKYELNNSSTIKNQILLLKEGGTRFALSYSKFTKLNVLLPSIAEQEKIANMLSSMDTLLTLRQRELDKLKQIKKGLLQKMFPSEGEDQPKIRFKGFTDAWEQQLVGEIGKIQTGNTPSTTNKANYSLTGLNWVTPTDIEGGYIENTAKKLSPIGELVARIVPANSILCTCIASIGKNAIIKEKSAFNQQINSLTVNENFHNPYFLYTLSYLWSNYMKSQAGGLTFQIVNKSEFSEIPTSLPTTKNEEDKIGEFFLSFDSLLTLRQRELDKLKQIKKGLLQKMFA